MPSLFGVVSVVVGSLAPSQGGDLATMPPLASHCWGVLACHTEGEENVNHGFIPRPERERERAREPSYLST